MVLVNQAIFFGCMLAVICEQLPPCKLRLRLRRLDTLMDEPNGKSVEMYAMLLCGSGMDTVNADVTGKADWLASPVLRLVMVSA